VDRTSRRIGRRHTMAVVATGFVAVAVLAGGGYALASRPAPAPDTAGTTRPGPTGAPLSDPPPGPSTVAAPPTAVPGTLSYLTVRAGQPIILTSVTDGVPRESAFGLATETDTYLLPFPSPDGTRLAAVDSPDPGFVAPGKLVIISAGGARRTIATAVGWQGGHVPVWMPDGQHIIATVHGRSSVIDVTTGEVTPAPAAQRDRHYLTWSGNGQWQAYDSGEGIVVTAADGSAAVRRSLESLAECRQQVPGCPTSVQAVSDDGRYVALGHHNTDPSHVREAHVVLDMRTGAAVTLPAAGRTRVDTVYFRPDGGMIVRTGTESGQETFVLLRADGTTLATFPDTLERAGRHLVGYRP
jgi:hypothetical protein